MRCKKGNGVALLQNDPAILNKTGEFSVKPILKIFKWAGSASSFVLYWVMSAPPNIIFLNEKLPAKSMPATGEKN